MRDELRTLRLVIAVAEAGSFTAVATRLGVEVSAVSRRIRDLEDSVGVSLFERLARGVRATDAGLSYVASAKDVLERIDRADADARLAGSGVRGRLNVAFVWSFGSGPIVDLMREFRSRNPSVMVRMFEKGDDELVAGLMAFEFDVILTAIVDPLHPRCKVMGQLNRQDLWSEQLMAVTPETVAAEPMTWADLAGHTILCRPEDDWQRFVTHVEERGGPTLSFSEQNVALDSLFGLVRAGLGWCILPANSIRTDVANVRVIPIISEGATLQVEAFWRPEADNPALARFLALSRRLFRQSAPI